MPNGAANTYEEVLKKWFIGSKDKGIKPSSFLIFDGEGQAVFRGGTAKFGMHNQRRRLYED